MVTLTMTEIYWLMALCRKKVDECRDVADDENSIPAEKALAELVCGNHKTLLKKLQTVYMSDSKRIALKNK